MKHHTKKISLTFNIDGDLSPEVEADINKVMAEITTSLCKQVEDTLYRSMISFTRHPKISKELKSLTVDVISEDVVVEKKEEVSDVVPAAENFASGSEVSG